MSLALGFIFIFAAAVSFMAVLLSFLALSKLNGNLSKGKHLSNLAIAILAASIFVYIGFSMYPVIEHNGAPTGEDYNRLAIKAGILGLSIGVGYVCVTVIRFIQSVAQRS